LKIAGIDPSSSCSGVALTEDQKLLLTDAWYKPKSGSAPDRLVDYFLWLQNWLAANTPDVVVIEFLSVIRNAEATRVISHYQAISALACKLRGLLVIEARVTSARKAALGRGNLSKEESYKMIKARFPQEDWGRINNGGADRADATVLALAGLELTER
jgi:Holliday junction resolvasome RuvABC endonuclease subunit